MYSLDAYKTLIETMASAINNNCAEMRSNSITITYSGRGMYGIECLGVVLNDHDMSGYKVDFLDEVAEVLVDSDDKDTKALFKDMKANMRSPSRDSMGLSVIEYYTRIKIPSEYKKEINELIAVLVEG